MKEGLEKQQENQKQDEQPQDDGTMGCCLNKAP